MKKTPLPSRSERKAIVKNAGFGVRCITCGGGRVITHPRHRKEPRIMSESERRQELEQLRPAQSGETDPFQELWSWSDRDITRLRAAFQMRFDEPLPRTETLMAVAAEGIRIFAERTRG